MTKEDYLKLSASEQEDFINNDGVIDYFSIPLEHPESAISLPHSQTTNASNGEGFTVLPSSTAHTVQDAPTFPSAITYSVGKKDRFDGYLIDSPVELLFLVDEEVSSGTVALHDWQVQFMLDFAHSKHTDFTPFQAIVQAANGSGKDKYIIAACVVWLCVRYQRALGVVTSSSGSQLDTQTCRHIKSLCESFNKKFGFPVWDCKYRQYQCNFQQEDGSVTSSNIYCYATDEAGKAEGYHPNEKGAKMGIFVSEDKSVTDEINIALNKCTGYSHRVHASTPGLPMGHFFNYSSSAILRSEIEDVTKVKPIDWIKYHITAHQCSHLSKEYFKQMERDLPGGKNGAAYKSQIEAEFGTTDEMVVIPYTFIWRSVRSKTIQWAVEPQNQAGLDLSDGGAETVLAVRNGNRLLKIIPFRFDDTEDTINFLDEQFRVNGLTHPEALINADCCGLGAPMIKALRRRGWKNMRFIDSRHTAREKRVYKNRGTELFFHMRTLLERNEIILLEDQTTMDQLGGRYYKIDTQNIHCLLSKLEQRSRKYPSPDRADAVNLCFWNYKSTFKEPILEGDKKPFEDLPTDKKEVVTSFDSRAWAKTGQRTIKSNAGQKDFSYLEEEIRDNNRLILLRNSETLTIKE